jgi:hypothetical protein
MKHRAIILMMVGYAVCVVIGMVLEARLLGDPHPFAWGHAGIGANAVANKCSDDDGKTWWPARHGPDGSFACFAADRPGGLGPFGIVSSITGRVKKEQVPAPALGFGEAK